MTALYLLAQAADAATWAFLPPGAELNPLGHHGPLSLALKVAGVVFVLTAAHLAGGRLGRFVLLVGALVGIVGALSNAAVLA